MYSFTQVINIHTSHWTLEHTIIQQTSIHDPHAYPSLFHTMEGST